MAMAAIAASPKGRAAMLSSVVAMPSITWRMKEGKPPLKISPTIARSGRRSHARDRGVMPMWFIR